MNLSISRLCAAMLAVAVTLVALPSDAGPRATSMMRESRSFLKVVRTIEATVVFAKPEKKAVVHDPSGGAPDTFVDGKPRRLSIVRDKSFELEGEDGTVESLTLKDLKFPRYTSEVRLLILALASRSYKASLRHLGVRFTHEVLTLDRINKKKVWAIGDGKAAVWLDREIYRPVRLYIGSGVLDKSTWVVEMDYNDEATSKGWFPETIRIVQDDVVRMKVRVTNANLN